MSDDEPPDSRRNYEVILEHNGEPDYVKINGEKLTPAKLFDYITEHERGENLLTQQQYELYKNLLERITIERQRMSHSLLCFIPSSYLIKSAEDLKQLTSLTIKS